MKLYKVSCTLTPKGFEINATPMECKETEKSYVGGGQRIDKGKLLKVDTTTYEFIWNGIRYYAWALESQLDEAQDMLKEKVISVFAERIEPLEAMKEHYFSILNPNTGKTIQP